MEKVMTQATPEGIREVLRQNVYDPEIGINVVDLGLVYDIDVTDENGKSAAHVEMTLTSPGCPLGPQIISAIQQYTHKEYPDLGAINVHVVWDPMWNPDMMTQEAKDQLGFF
jgi:metal-sulfur cluster biosynthetic enzyme